MANKFGLGEKDLEQIIAILKNHPEVDKAWIFGSRAKGNHKRGSDVDIAVRGENLNFAVISHLNYMLNEETFMPYEFDILNYETIKNPELCDHIHRVGIPIYQRLH
jgi:uncharacterized protein